MTEELKISITEEKGRIDKVLAEKLANYSRSQIQLWLKEACVKIDDVAVKANYKVQKGDVITIQIPEPETLDLIAENLPLEIVYEDADVAVNSLSSINGVIRPGIVHRIDKDTSGLLMVAKNDQAHEDLAKQLKDKTSLRKYVALVHGVIPHDKGVIRAPIGRSTVDRKMQAVVDNGKDAVTHFQVLERYDDYTLVELQLETGRTHQIRVHMQYIGYPLVGDPVYGLKRTIKGNGQFLHAKLLGFTHPSTGEKMEFEAPLPEIFKKTLAKLPKSD